MAGKKIPLNRIIAIILWGWLAVIGFDFFLHGGLLASLYMKPSSFLLPPKQAFQLIPIGYLSFLIFQIFIVWLMVRMGVSGWKDGFLFGLKVGAFTWGAFCLGLLSISTASLELMAGWFIGQTVEAGIGGMVAGSGIASKSMKRIIIYVLLFFIAAIFITVFLQSAGFAPAVIAD